MMDTRPVARVDLFAGLFTTLLGIAGLVESLRMPRFAERGVDPSTVPGVTPGLISAALILFGVALTLRALGGGSPGSGVSIHSWTRASAFRTALTVGLAGIYGGFLFGNLPFVPVTAAFVFAFVFLLELRNPDRNLPLPALAGGALALALAAAFGIQLVFEEIFLVRLPG